MLVNFLTHLLALDIGWFIGLIAGNLFLLFGFLMLAHIFSPKRWIAFFFVFTFVVWGWTDIATITGWSILLAGFLLLSYFKTLAAVALVENSPLPPNYVIIVSEIAFVILFVWYGIFVIGGG